MDQCDGRLDQCGNDSGVCGFRQPACSRVERPGLSLEYFNEPDTYACLAYLLGGFPPQHKWKLGQFRKVIEHMARAHVQASRIIRREGNAGRKPEVGIAKNWTFFHAYKTYSPWDRTHGLRVPLYV